MAADHGARDLREGDDPRRALERFEPAHDLRLLHGEALGGEGLVRFGAERLADAEEPPVERGEPRAALGAGVEVRMRLACDVQRRANCWSSR